MGAKQSVIIRRADTSDCSRLTMLMHESSAYQGTYASILVNYSVTPDMLSANQVFVAEENGFILGFFSLIVAGDQAELDLMFVLDAAQGRNIGARLFDHMKAIATSLGVVAVKVISHPGAEGFYRRMGARLVGTQAPSGKATWPRPIFSFEIPNAS